MSGLVTVSKIARRLNVHENTVRRWVREGRLPRPEKLNRQLYVWSADKIEPCLTEITRSLNA